MSKIDKARWAVDMTVETDASKKVALCKDLNDNMYKDELYELALELGLSIDKSYTKKRLCNSIIEFVTTHPDEVNQWFYDED